MRHALLVVLLALGAVFALAPAQAQMAGFSGLDALGTAMVTVVTGAVTQPSAVEGTAWFQRQINRRVAEMGKEAFEAWQKHVRKVLENAKFPPTDPWLSGFPIRRAYAVTIVAGLCDVDSAQFGGCWPNMSDERKRLWLNDIYGQYKIACALAREATFDAAERAKIDKELEAVNVRLDDLDKRLGGLGNEVHELGDRLDSVESDVAFLMGRPVVVDVTISKGRLWKAFQIGRKEVVWADAGEIVGTPGPAGVGIASICELRLGVARIALTDGRYFDLPLPRGEKGDKGDKGDPGAPGNDGANGSAGANGVSPAQLMLRVVEINSTQTQTLTQSGEASPSVTTGDNSPVGLGISISNSGSQSMTGPVVAEGGNAQAMVTVHRLEWSGDGGTTWLPLCDIRDGAPGLPGTPGRDGEVVTRGPAVEYTFAWPSSPLTAPVTAPTVVAPVQAPTANVSAVQEPVIKQVPRTKMSAETGDHSPVGMGSGQGTAGAQATTGAVTATGGNAQVTNILNLSAPATPSSGLRAEAALPMAFDSRGLSTPGPGGMAFLPGGAEVTGSYYEFSTQVLNDGTCGLGKAPPQPSPGNAGGSASAAEIGFF